MTICVKDKKPLLGSVNEGIVELSPFGHVVEHALLDLPNHYGNIDLDEFIVMPNHFHGILWILDSETAQTNVGAGLRPAPAKTIKSTSLPEVIRAFKSFSTRRINEQRKTKGRPFWQRGFHEHIIRSEDDLLNHQSYVLENPLKWELDEYFL